jgi:hypothetical protein
MCLSIVRSLRHNSAAMILLVLPPATNRRTCNSRGVSECGDADLARFESESR